MSILSRLKRAAVALLNPEDDLRDRVDLIKAIIQMEQHCTALITRLQQSAAAAYDDWQEAVARIEVLEQDLLHAQQDAARHHAMREDDAPDRLTSLEAEVVQQAKQIDTLNAYIERQRAQILALTTPSPDEV
jgi:uncharacterized coiled-coil protein SlyX